ncbi:HIT-like protein [Periconia macrospinosa]|uniref:Aprataxin-like protein n=1 Tax=Periconia macrospinosa TaxID=97972 RepID=A0A2V1DX87_9PLEO|nr:HIT-like protein [Periconia macrospinosa]
MSASKKTKAATISAEDAPKQYKTYAHNFKEGLGIYIEHPERNPEGRVVEYDDDFVVINDKFPKASVHLLLLPRNPSIAKQHPLSYLSTEPTFLASVRARAEQVANLAAAELRRQYGSHSASDAPYQSALEDMMSAPSTVQPEQQNLTELPPGRDWRSEIQIGVHTHPSMSHMHVHIISREANSPWLKHKKHYLSFHTRFWVGLDEFPLVDEGRRRVEEVREWPGWDLVCWKCGRGFGNRFKEFKGHLEEEFEGWKRE